jgi:hypothetical protein
MKRTFSPKARQKNLVVQELSSEVLIYDLQSNKAFCLNETSAMIYDLCDGTKTVSKISQRLGEKLNSPVAEDFVWLAIDQFKKDDLLANGDETESRFSGFSRREALRKIGLAAAIALPVVTSLVAPVAASAQSGVCGGSCTCSVPNTDSFLPKLCRLLGGTSACPNRTTCDCFVVAGVGSKGGTCTGT